MRTYKLTLSVKFSQSRPQCSVPPGFRDFAVTEMNVKSGKLRDIRRGLRFFRITADLGRDVSCDVITMHDQPKPSSIRVRRTSAQPKGLIYRQASRAKTSLCNGRFNISSSFPQKKLRVLKKAARAGVFGHSDLKKKNLCETLYKLSIIRVCFVIYILSILNPDRTL